MFVIIFVIIIIIIIIIATYQIIVPCQLHAPFLVPLQCALLDAWREYTRGERALARKRHRLIGQRRTSGGS